MQQYEKELADVRTLPSFFSLVHVSLCTDTEPLQAANVPMPDDEEDI